MRIRFSFFNTLTILGLTLFLFFFPNYGSSEERNRNRSAVSGAACVEEVAGRHTPRIVRGFEEFFRPRGYDRSEEDDEENRQYDIEIGYAAAVCELIFGKSFGAALPPGSVYLPYVKEIKRLDSYRALMTADKITQQALVKDHLQKWFGMDAEGISAGMAQFAAQRKKQEEKEKEAAAKKEAADDAFAVFDIPADEARATTKKAADDAFAVFDIPAEEARAAIKRAADDAVNKQLKNGGNIDTKQMNTQTYVDANGNKGTLWCNPGPCTLGSALRHGWISGAGTLLPEELVGTVTKILTTDSETSSSAIRSEIFNITLKTIKEAAETSADPKLKSAAAMTTEQIKSKQVANEKSQEDKSGNLVEVEEAPEDKAPVEEVPVEEVPVEEAPVEEAPVEEDHHHDDGTEAPVDEGTEAPVEEWDDDCLGMEQCNVPIEG
jgi:hypothetical protein